jgi:chromosome segregation ATPase
VGRAVGQGLAARVDTAIGAAAQGLADHFQLASQSLARQKDELQQLLSRLARQQKKIEVQRTELQRWAAQRQTALEEEAARLLSRQHVLDRQDAEIRGLREQWEAQRREYQEEIRRLMSRLRQASAAQMLP